MNYIYIGLIIEYLHVISNDMIDILKYQVYIKDRMVS